MTTRYGRPSARLTLLAAGSILALLTVSACGSAQDLADEASPTTAAPTSPPTTTPPTTDPTPTPTPTPKPTPSVATPKRGQCRTIEIFDLVTRVSRSSASPISCARSHSGQTYAVRSLSGPLKRTVTSGSSAQILRVGRGYCERELTAWLKADLAKLKRSQFDFVIGVPGASDIAAGSNWLRCDLFLKDGVTRTARLPSTRAALKGGRANRYLTCVKGNISTASGTVPCARTHQWKGVSSVKLGTASKSFPGSGKVRAVMKRECGSDVRSYLNTRGAFRYGYILPTRSTWTRGDRWGVCFANTRT